MSRCNKKTKSFGLIEAVVASMIMVLLLTGAVALASASLRNMTTNSNYHAAEQLADSLMEKAVRNKAAGLIAMTADENDSLPTGQEKRFSIKCFDTLLRNGSNCQLSARNAYKDGLPYPNPPSDTSRIVKYGAFNYVKTVGADLNNTAFPGDFFAWRIAVSKLPDYSGSCPYIGSQPIVKAKCSLLTIDVRWEQASGEKHYYLRQYFADWEK